VDDGHRPCRKHLLEMRPIKYVLSSRLLFLFSLQLLRLRYGSVAFQGVPLHKATRRVLTVPSEPMELTPFQDVTLQLWHSPCRTKASTKKLSESSGQKTDAAGVCAHSLLQVAGWRLPP
jgi:hypothetical protein